mmetsp:Transcript_70483/g.211987  ORF Transcript_70483/g.211987 Transcript_70483/m.211987 type:complete len:225 (-) Transcript_70483:93-767(-)
MVVTSLRMVVLARTLLGRVTPQLAQRARIALAEPVIELEIVDGAVSVRVEARDEPRHLGAAQDAEAEVAHRVAKLAGREGAGAVAVPLTEYIEHALRRAAERIAQREQHKLLAADHAVVACVDGGEALPKLLLGVLARLPLADHYAKLLEADRLVAVQILSVQVHCGVAHTRRKFLLLEVDKASCSASLLDGYGLEVVCCLVVGGRVAHGRHVRYGALGALGAS